jgi:hypothetical protein
MDESPLKVTLRVNTLKRVDPIKDKSDAISALQNQVAEAEKAAETSDEDDGTDDNDGDGVDNADERAIGTDPDNPEDTPTDAQIEELRSSEE